MRSNYKMRLLAAAAALLAVGTLAANDAGGTFTLPFQTSWGSAVLKPGRYTFVLDRATIDGTITISQGRRVIAMIGARGFIQTRRAAGSSISIVGHRVCSLYLRSVGIVYEYCSGVSTLPRPPARVS